MKRVDRITKMEAALDASREAVDKLSEALEAYEAAFAQLNELSAYYGSTQWMRDREADENGKLPQELKRGVLSEDLAYDLIVDNRELVTRMAKIVSESLYNDIV